MRPTHATRLSLLSLSLATLCLTACGGEDAPSRLDAREANEIAASDPDPYGIDEPFEAEATPPVERYGALSVTQGQLVATDGQPVQLKGVSSMWLNWEPTGYARSLEGLRHMRDDWGLEVVRAAMGVEPDGAYLQNPDVAKSQVRQIVENAIELGVYVIIDWHDHEALDHQTQAEAFFVEMAETYGNLPNVIFEVFNEPLMVDWSSQLKPYHEALVQAIRGAGSENIIVLGTPTWSQDVDIAANDPVAGDNLMYTLHFYSCTHNATQRGKAAQAFAAGAALFVTEWGATHADGGLDGLVCESEAGQWLDWLDQNQISWTAWKLDGCTDSTCMFTSRAAPTTGGWTSDWLNGHAPFVISRMREP